MRTPRKLYIVVSRVKRAPFTVPGATFASRPEAEAERDRRNENHVGGVADWRVEVFVKGD